MIISKTFRTDRDLRIVSDDADTRIAADREDNTGGSCHFLLPLVGTGLVPVLLRKIHEGLSMAINPSKSPSLRGA